MGTVMKHPVPDRVKPDFVIFDSRALWRSRLSVRVLGSQKLQNPALPGLAQDFASIRTVKQLDIMTGCGRDGEAWLKTNRKYKCPLFPVAHASKRLRIYATLRLLYVDLKNSTYIHAWRLWCSRTKTRRSSLVVKLVLQNHRGQQHCFRN